MSLAALGLTVREERVYRSMLARKAPDLLTLARDVGLDPATVEKAIGALHRRRLLEADESFPLGMRVRLPSLALAELAQRVAERLGDDLVKIAGVQAEFVALDELAREPLHPAAGEAVSAVGEVVRGESDIRRCIEQLAHETRMSLDSMQESPRSTRLVMASPDLSRTYRRGVAIRWLAHDSLRDNEHYVLRMEDAAANGALVRSTPDPLTRLIIADRSVALVPHDADHPSDALVIVRHPVLVARLLELFDRTWASATPFPREGAAADTAPTAAAFGDAERDLLRTLATHATDELAARAMFISVRQLQRRVTAAFQTLGAVNRFHAGALAERLGLLGGGDDDPGGTVTPGPGAPTRRRG